MFILAREEDFDPGLEKQNASEQRARTKVLRKPEDGNCSWTTWVCNGHTKTQADEVPACFVKGSNCLAGTFSERLGGSLFGHRFCFATCTVVHGADISFVWQRVPSNTERTSVLFRNVYRRTRNGHQFCFATCIVVHVRRAIF